MNNAARFANAVLLLSAAILLANPVFAQESSDAWTPEYMINYKRVGGTVISPDGKLVAYTVSVPKMEGTESTYLTHIHLASADGAFDRQFTFGDKSSSSPAFSPDGKYLSFTTSRSDKNQVWLMYLTGGEAFQLTDAKNGVSGYKWSPDGSHIAYTMVDPLTEEEEKAREEKWDAEMVDQNYKYNHLYKIIVSDNGDEENESERLTEGEFYIQGFNWSPDGRNIVFSHRANPLLNDRSTSDISAVSASGGEPTLLVGWEGGDNNPVYSPDGTKIAFSSSGGSVQDVGLSEIYIIPSGGGEPVKLAETPNRSSNLLGWSLNGNEIYYFEPDKTSMRIFAMNVENGEIRTISSGRYNYGSISFSAKSDNYLKEFKFMSSWTFVWK